MRAGRTAEGGEWGEAWGRGFWYFIMTGSEIIRLSFAFL